MLGPDLDDDLVESTATAPEAPTDDDPEFVLPPLPTDSPLAKALASVWQGERLTIVDAPPGAGKSSLIAALVAQLATRLDVSIAVATPTRAQALGIAAKLASTCPPGAVVLADKRVDEDDVPAGVVYSTYAKPERGHPVVRNLKAWRGFSNEIDVMVVDEAYQATHSMVLGVAETVKQFLLVGDPGQIGPVVSVNTKMWDGSPFAPHLRAPDALRRRPECVSIRMESTYRLGPVTVDAVAPLYDFPFTSARPDCEVVGEPEIGALRLPTARGKDDMSMLRAVADRAATLVGRTVTSDATPDAPAFRRALQPSDVAVVVAHNTQRAAVSAFLKSKGIDEVTVGTADKLQGGEWQAVVALDPLIGQDDAQGHGGSLGRLCVMISRHRAHLTWVHDGTWQQVIDADDELALSDRATMLQVRRRLTGAPAITAPSELGRG